MTATYSGGTYTISRTQDTTATSIYSNASGTEYKLYKMVYVVFLGQSGLYWQDPGAAQGTELVFTGIPFYYSNSSGTTNMWTNALQSQYSVNLTLVVPSTNSSFSAWQQVYNNYNAASTPSAKLDILKAAWRNTSLVFYENSSSSNSAKLYSGTYTSGSQSNTQASAGVYRLDDYLRYSPAPGVILTGSGALENGDTSTGVTVINGFDSSYTQSYSSVGAGSAISIYASKSTPSWRAANSGDWDIEYSATGAANSWSSIGGMSSSGGNTAMGSLTAPSNSGNYYYRSIFNINDSSGIGPDYISPTLTLNVSDPYTISGTISVSPGYTPASGFITVNQAPVTITLNAFGGSGGFFSSCYTSATLNISQGGSLYGSIGAYASNNNTNSNQITLSSNGTYTYNLSATFGCSSGNSAYIT